MKKLTYYPGCSAHGTSREYENSVKIIMDALGIELQEIPDWNCCGASSAHVMNDSLSLALPMRNLILAQSMESKEITISCASCFSRMKTAKVELDANESVSEKLNKEMTEGKYNGSVNVTSVLQHIYESVGTEELKKMVKKPLTGLKAACYYGCLLTRPKNIVQFDSPEYPVSMDQVVEALGAEAVPFDFKTECCGAAFSISAADIVYELSGKIIEMAKEAGADLIAVACPLCHSNLDMRQKGKMPVLYFTQLIALAMGHDSKDLMFGKHYVSVEPVLEKINSIQ